MLRLSDYVKRTVLLAVAGVAVGLSADAAVALNAPKPEPVAVHAVAPLSSAAVDPRGDAAPVIQVRARGGGGRVLRGSGGVRHFGHRGRFYGAPLLLAPAFAYGAYYYGDCRPVRVKERRCWLDDDGDRACGTRWVIRQICD